MLPEMKFPLFLKISKWLYGSVNVHTLDYYCRNIIYTESPNPASMAQKEQRQTNENNTNLQ